jgi:hypothetical protein
VLKALQAARADFVTRLAGVTLCVALSVLLYDYRAVRSCSIAMTARELDDDNKRRISIPTCGQAYAVFPMHF